MSDQSQSDEGVEQLLDTLESELATSEEVAESEVDARVAELVGDLQRLQAEYANYRRRVERDRETFKDAGIASALMELLPLLDDIARARSHDDVNGTFKVVADNLDAVVKRLGLEVFGDAGDVFDPTMHEAIAHEVRDDVTSATCVTVHQQGFRFAGRVVRPALVTVADSA